jgi:DNA-binding NarL/FixJ family response regulator
MSPSEQMNWTEIDIATLVWQGRTNPEIARLLSTSEQVIKNHLRSIFDKLGVWTRLELALYVAAHGGQRWAARLPASSGNALGAAAGT